VRELEFGIRNSAFDISPHATTRSLAIMNLALRGIEADFGPENADTFLRDFCSLEKVRSLQNTTWQHVCRLSLRFHLRFGLSSANDGISI